MKFICTVCDRACFLETEDDLVIPPRWCPFDGKKNCVWQDTTPCSAKKMIPWSLETLPELPIQVKSPHGVAIIGCADAERVYIYCFGGITYAELLDSDWTFNGQPCGRKV
jgi:hypothetical protein